MISAAIEAALEKAPGEASPLRDPIDAGSYDGGKFVAIGEAKHGAGWRTGKVGRDLLPMGSIRGDYTKYDVLRADKAGAELEFEFEGRGVGAFVLAGPDAGIVEASVDGSPYEKHDLFHRFSGGLNYPRSVILATDLKDGKHVLKLRLADEKNAKSKGNTASILFFEVNG